MNVHGLTQKEAEERLKRDGLNEVPRAQVQFLEGVCWQALELVSLDPGRGAAA